MPRKLLTAIAVSTFLALLVSLVPTVPQRGSGGDIAAYRPVAPIVLSEQNLVDLFTMIPTHYNIKHVKWESRSLYVDIAVAPSERLTEQLLFQDVYSLLYRCFQLTRNVDHLFFRLLERDEGRSVKLLVAIQVDRPPGVFHFPPPEQMANPQQLINGVASKLRFEPAYEDKLSR
ncbi:hypothetical protein [Brevibacillus marinus]|jgi:hypothetical protein|uniref:hypothetical protein n=1 Tax=Brevibacillus marinus TaxID=2496837 RepID=UPI000F827838|nr:hypothetical protein [Brevibacillus marinus]